MDTMTRIGNSADAELAVEQAVQFGHGGEYYLGSGGNRKAFLIDGIVYKVDHDPVWDNNRHEHDKYVNVFAHLEIPAHLNIQFVPIDMYEVVYGDTHYYVNALPFIDGEPVDIPPRSLSQWLEGELHLFDIYSDNAIVKDGITYIVDMEG